MPAALLTLAGWQFLELEQREKAPRFFWAFSAVLCARRTPHDTLLKLFAVPFSKTSAALPGPLLLIVLPQAISRTRPRPLCCLETLCGSAPAHRAASRDCHSEASCNAAEPTLLIALYQGLSWCYVQVVVPMWHWSKVHNVRI